MSDIVKAVVVIAVAGLIGEGMWIYFSPFQTCRRVSSSDEALIMCIRTSTPGNWNNTP